MSLILGLHLTRRIYLIADSKVTYEEPSIRQTEDLIKAFVFNKRIGAVAAGHAYAASWILNEIKNGISEDTNVTQLKKFIEVNLTGIIRKYGAETGYIQGRIAVIIGGFDPTKQKLIESSKLGLIMSAQAKLRRGGVVKQNIPREITQALTNEILRKGVLKRGMRITLDPPDSKLFSLTVDITSLTFTLEEIGCFEYEIFHPDFTFSKEAVPAELISEIEFGDKDFSTSESQLYKEAEILSSFVSRILAKRKFNTVGGHIFPFLQTPEGMLFPTGSLGQLREGRTMFLGEIRVEGKAIYYIYPNGKKIKFKNLSQLDDNSLKLFI